MAWEAGQEVLLYRGSYGGHVFYKRVKIDRVTPSGIAAVGTDRFSPDGRRRGELGSHHRTRIIPFDQATWDAQEAKDNLERLRETVSKIGRKSHYMDAETCQRIIDAEGSSPKE